MTPMTSALALARHRLVIERRDGPRWAEALREGAAWRERESEHLQTSAFEMGSTIGEDEMGWYLQDPNKLGFASWPSEREVGLPVLWRLSEWSL